MVCSGGILEDKCDRMVLYLDGRIEIESQPKARHRTCLITAEGAHAEFQSRSQRHWPLASYVRILHTTTYYCTIGNKEPVFARRHMPA